MELDSLINIETSGRLQRMAEQQTGSISSTSSSSTNLSAGQFRNRRRPLLQSVANRLRLAAHWSRAKRQDDVTEPTIGLVIDNHELYTRQTLKSSKPSKPPMKLSKLIRLTKLFKDSESNNNLFLAKGNVHFWRDYTFGDVN